MSEFITDLDARLLDDDRIWMLLSPLVYISDIMGKIIAPTGFQMDFASVPRIPIIYMSWGDRAHREAVIHDLLFCSNSKPWASFDMANDVFLEAMICRKKPLYIRQPMYRGVCWCGRPYYHKRKVEDILCPPKLITT